MTNKRNVMLYLDGSLIEELKNRKINISSEINRLLQELINFANEKDITKEEKDLKEVREKSEQAYNQWYLERKTKEDVQEKLRLEQENSEWELKFNELRAKYNEALDQNNKEKAKEIQIEMKKLKPKGDDKNDPKRNQI